MQTSTPKLAADVFATELGTGDSARTVFKHKRYKTHVVLSGSEAAVLRACDGTRALEQLSALPGAGVVSPRVVGSVLKKAEEALLLDGGIKPKRPPAYNKFKLPTSLLTDAVNAVPPALAMVLHVVVVLSLPVIAYALMQFNAAFTGEDADVFMVAGTRGNGALLFVAALLFALLHRELARGLLLRALKLEAGASGFSFRFGLPAWSLDDSDTVLASRPARVYFRLALLALVAAPAAALFLVAYQIEHALLFEIASVSLPASMLILLFSCSPFADTDGVKLVETTFGKSNLREELPAFLLSWVLPSKRVGKEISAGQEAAFMVLLFFAASWFMAMLKLVVMLTNAGMVDTFVALFREGGMRDNALVLVVWLLLALLILTMVIRVVLTALRAAGKYLSSLDSARMHFGVMPVIVAAGVGASFLSYTEAGGKTLAIISAVVFAVTALYIVAGVAKHKGGRVARFGLATSLSLAGLAVAVAGVYLLEDGELVITAAGAVAGLAGLAALFVALTGLTGGARIAGVLATLLLPAAAGTIFAGYQWALYGTAAIALAALARLFWAVDVLRRQPPHYAANDKPIHGFLDTLRAAGGNFLSFPKAAADYETDEGKKALKAIAKTCGKGALLNDLLRSASGAVPLTTLEQAAGAVLAGQPPLDVYLAGLRGKIEAWKKGASQVAIFHALPPEKRGLVLDAVSVREFNDGEKTVVQGEQGHSFFSILDGHADVIVTQQSGQEVYVATLAAGDSFGEIALLQDSPRTATVAAKGNLSCAVLDREAFSRVFGADELGASLTETIRRSSFLRGLPICEDFTPAELVETATAFEVMTVTPDQQIMRQGDAGDRFYLIQSGELEVFQGEGAEQTVLARLGAGSYVGEIALLSDAPRNASVRAVEQSTLLFLTREKFRDIFMRSKTFAAHLQVSAERRAAEGGAA